MSEVNIEELNKFRNIGLQFIDTNKQNLISIYLKHANGTEENEGDGILIINFNEFEKTNKIDVSFIALKLLSDELLNEITKCKERNNENIIYFLFITPYEDKIIEIDMRTLISS
jgi:hypothetical protein